jgi:hypothetical protein
MATANVYFNGLDDIAKKINNARIKQQTDKLCVYASKMIKKINTFREAGMSNPSGDWTGNLGDSLCWIVYYNGNIANSGYARNQAMAQDAQHDSSVSGDIWGRELANNFIRSHNPSTTKGWEVVWAATVNYASKLEKGNSDVHKGVRLRIISQVFDNVVGDFKGKAKITIKGT